jgi:hypothetical protein
MLSGLAIAVMDKGCVTVILAVVETILSVPSLTLQVKA